MNILCTIQNWIQATAKKAFWASTYVGLSITKREFSLIRCQLIQTSVNLKFFQRGSGHFFQFTLLVQYQPFLGLWCGPYGKLERKTPMCLSCPFYMLELAAGTLNNSDSKLITPWQSYCPPPSKNVINLETVVWCEGFTSSRETSWDFLAGAKIFSRKDRFLQGHHWN